MKIHTSDFKIQSRTNGKRINSEINYGENSITKYNINSLKFTFNTELFRTIMKQVTFDTNIQASAKTWVNPKFGYKVGDAYEMLDYGSYYINEKPIYNADNRAYTHIAYDSMIEAMIMYDDSPLSITYPITYGNLLLAIATKLGWTFTQTEFPNENTEIPSDIYKDLGLTYRDILDDLCPASMGNIIVTDDKEMQIIYPIETSDTIDEHYLDQDNINIGKKIGPINALVLSRAEDGDTINRRDEDNITENGLQEIKIKDNLLLSSEFRENFIDEMFDKIKGFEYYEFDIKTVGLAYYDLLDKFTISLNGNSYSTVVLNCDLTIEGGVQEQIYAPTLEESVTDYSTSSKTDKAKKMATIIAYKNQAKIEAVAKEVKDLTDYVRSISNTGDYIGLANTPPSSGAINKLSIKGFELKTRYKNMAYKSNYTYKGVLNFYTLIFSNELVTYMPILPEASSEHENKLFNVGGLDGKFYRCKNIESVYEWVEEIDLSNVELRYINSPVPLQKLGDVYDEMLIEQNKIKIIQRIGYDFDNEQWSVLSSPITHELGDVLLPTFDGDTYVTLKYFTNLVFNAEYLIKNELTSNFSTQLETATQFQMTQDEIGLRARRDKLISEINLSPEEVKIKAPRIDLNGYISNDKGSFEITEEGKAKFREVEIYGTNLYLPSGGKVVGGDGILSNLQFKSNGNYAEYSLVGFVGFGDQVDKSSCFLDAHIPTNFTIISAILTIYHTPCKWTINYGQSEGTGYCRNLKLYKINSGAYYTIDNVNNYISISPSNITEIENGLGVETWQPSNTTVGTVEIKTGNDIKSSLTTGRNTLVIRTIDSNPDVESEDDISLKTGALMAILDVVGYTSYEE